MLVVRDRLHPLRRALQDLGSARVRNRATTEVLGCLGLPLVHQHQLVPLLFSAVQSESRARANTTKRSNGTGAERGRWNGCKVRR